MINVHGFLQMNFVSRIWIMIFLACSIKIGRAVMLDFLITCLFMQVFIAISIILGDGLYNLVKIFVVIAKEFCSMQSKQRDLPVQALEGNMLLLSCSAMC